MTELAKLLRVLADRVEAQAKTDDAREVQRLLGLIIVTGHLLRALRRALASRLPASMARAA